MHRGGGTVAVVGVEQDPVRQHLDPAAEVAQLVGHRLVLPGLEADLDHLAAGPPPDELRRRALGDDPGLVHDHQPVAQLLGLVHVVGGEDQRHTLLFEPEQSIPQHVPRLRVETGGRLVEQQHLRLVDQAAGDGEPALHAAGQRVDLGVAPVAELHEVEQLLGPLPDNRLGQPEVAPVDQQVFPDGQLHVQRVLLRDHAEPAPDPGAVGGRIQTEDPQRAGGDRGDAADHPHRAALAGPVGTEEPERLAVPHLDVDPVHRGEVTEALGQAAGVHQRLGRGLGHGGDATGGHRQIRAGFSGLEAAPHRLGWHPFGVFRRWSGSQSAGKKSAISRLADSGPSEPWTMLFCTSRA